MKKKTTKKLFLKKMTVSNLSDLQMDNIRGGNTGTEVPELCDTYGKCTLTGSDIGSCITGLLFTCHQNHKERLLIALAIVIVFKGKG